MKTIVGLFDSHHDADSTVRDLERADLGRDSTSVVASEDVGREAQAGGPSGATALLASSVPLTVAGAGPVMAAGPLLRQGTALNGALTSAGVPDEHARYYVEGVRRGGTLVVVSASDDESERVMDIMNRHHPVDIEDRAAAWRENRGDVVAAAAARANADTASTTAAGNAETNESEQRVPVVEEQLRVGKREVERGGVRVQSRVEETPIEEQVNLREEHVRVDRHPVDRPVTAGDVGRAFVEGTIEVTERAEEPVVEKEARVVEEVVVAKEASERTETIRDTVRRTDVEIQPVEVEGAGASQSGDFSHYESDFRTNFQSTNRGSDYGFDQVKPAYRYGYELAGDRTRAGDWSTIEPEARSRWEQRNPGTWDKFKDAARYAYDRARSKGT